MPRRKPPLFLVPLGIHQGWHQLSVLRVRDGRNWVSLGIVILSPPKAGTSHECVSMATIVHYPLDARC